MKCITLLSTLLLVAACGHANGLKAREVDPNYDDVEAIFLINASLRSVCERADIEGFKYYLFREARVRQTFVSPVVKVTRPDKGVQSQVRERYVMPTFGIHQGVEMVTGGPEEWAWLKVDVKPLAEGAFQLEWVRAKYERIGAGAMPGRLERTYGPIGRLTFVRTAQCWELGEDR
jgi:hypothetical protein